MDMEGVMERLPWTISLTARGATPMARAIAFWEMPMGARYSSRRISPGVIGWFMAITYCVIAELSMIVPDGDITGAIVRPAEDDAPLGVNANGMHAGKVAFQGLEAVAGRYL